MNSDVRQQIIVSLRAEGEGEAASKVRDSLTSIDVGLHKLQMTGIKFGDALAASMQKAAEAAEAMALKQAEAFAKAAETHEKFLERDAAATEAAALKEAESFAKAAETHEKFLEREAAAAEASAIKQAEAFARAAEAHEKFLERDAAATEAAAIHDAEVMAQAATRHEQMMARAAASEEAFATQGIVGLDDLRMSGIKLQDTQRATNMAIARGDDAMDKATQASSKLGMGILYASHGLQDLMYGFSSFLNNIPLIVTAAGGGPGLAGTIMAVGVGFTLLKPKLEEAGAALVAWGRDIIGIQDPTKKAANTVEELTTKLEALRAKPNKLEIDFASIEAAERKLSELEAKLESFNSHVNDATPLQEKVSKEIGTIISEHSGGTDDKSGTQNLLDLIENMLRKQGDQAHGGEFMAREPGYEKYRQRSEAREGILERRGKGEFLFGEDAQLKLLNKEIAELEHGKDGKGGIIGNARNRIKAMIEDARAGRDSGIQGLANAFRRSPDSFLKPGGGLSPVDPAFADMLEQARGANIKAREEEDAAEKRAESASQTDKDIRAIRKKAADNRAREAAKEAAAKKKEQAAKKKIVDDRQQVADKATRAHDQAVSQHASRYGGPMSQQTGPGSLTDDIIDRIRQGQSNADIVGGMKGGIRGRLTDVPDNMADEVASQIIDDAVGKVRATVAATPGGAGALAAQRTEKLGRAQATVDARADRQQTSAMEHNIGQQIYTGTGGQLGQQGTAVAAHRAMQSMQHGVNGQAAMFEAAEHTFQQILQMQQRGIDAQAQFMQMLNGVNVRLNGLHAQQKRNQAQRPSLLPMFQ